MIRMATKIKTTNSDTWVKTYAEGITNAPFIEIKDADENQIANALMRLKIPFKNVIGIAYDANNSMFVALIKK